MDCTALFQHWVLMVSLFDMPLYKTRYIWTQVYTGLTFFLLLALASIIKNLHSTVPLCNIWQSLTSNCTALKYWKWSWIQKLLIVHCSTFSDRPRMKLPWFAILAIWLHTYPLACGVLLWMWARRLRWLLTILHLGHQGGYIHNAELMRLAAQAIRESLVIQLSANHQNKAAAEWWNTCWQQCTSQS